MIILFDGEIQTEIVSSLAHSNEKHDTRKAKTKKKRTKISSYTILFGQGD